MTYAIQNIIESRSSINHFLPDRPLDDETIHALIGLATRAPSAYNLQNWRFIAVRSEHGKQRLKEAAYGQQKVVDASVSIIVCGTLASHLGLGAALQPSVDQGVMPQGVADGWVEQVSVMHQDNPGLQRDEAIRSASLSAMTLMLAAEGMGLGSCAMVGFDPVKVGQEFDLGVNDIPVVIVTVGYPTGNNWSQKPRKPLSEVLAVA